MKTKVYATREETKQIADETYRLMVADGVTFPIKQSFHGLKKFIFTAQQKILPIERRSTFGSTERRQKMIDALNYRYRQSAARMSESFIDAPIVTTMPVTEAVVAKTIQPDAKQSVTELGQVVGAYLSADTEMMKVFINGLMTAFTMGMTGR